MTPKEKALVRRYLVWCYKTTKEELDRIDRKFTQVLVDRHIEGKLKKSPAQLTPDNKAHYEKLSADFSQYIRTKEEEGAQLKFSDTKKKSPTANYLYLKNRLSALEDAIAHFLGKKDLRAIKASYEEEMTGRIWEAREH